MMEFGVDVVLSLGKHVPLATKKHELDDLDMNHVPHLIFYPISIVSLCQCGFPFVMTCMVSLALSSDMLVDFNNVSNVDHRACLASSEKIQLPTRNQPIQSISPRQHEL